MRGHAKGKNKEIFANGGNNNEKNATLSVVL